MSTEYELSFNKPTRSPSYSPRLSPHATVDPKGLGQRATVAASTLPAADIRGALVTFPGHIEQELASGNRRLDSIVTTSIKASVASIKRGRHNSE